MTNPKKKALTLIPRSDAAQALRQRAEARAAAKTAQQSVNRAPPPHDLQFTIHELKVHQIELEIQNEELQRIHAELETSRARYFDLYNLAPVGYFTVGGEGRIREANLTAAKLLGVVRGDLVDRLLSSFVFPEDQDTNYLEFKRLYETGQRREWEMRLMREGSQPFWACVEAIKVQDADGAFAFHAIISDISERVRTREELQCAHRQYAAILESISDGFNAFDHECLCTWVNTAGAKMFGKTPAELLGKSVWELWPEAVDLPIGNAFSKRDCENVAVQVEEFYSEPLHGWFEVRHYPSPEGFSLFFTDVTERRSVEEARRENCRALESAVNEKTVLLQEIHHRVKNNLAVISGMLSMKADVTASVEAKAVLEASQQRLHSMALIHDHLYGSSSLERINFADYASALTQWLLTTFVGESDRISMELDVDPIEIGIERAMPCALILNELLSNAFKYAFPDQRKGMIRVALHESSPGLLELAVEDDGVGLPAGIPELNPKSIGLKSSGS